MEQLLYIAVLGALGCICRYLLSGLVYKLFGTGFPYGTLAVNVVGAFLIGLIMEFSIRSALIPPALRIALTIGFLGGLTTFYTFSFETFRLLEEGALLMAILNVLVSVVCCLACTWVGIAVARTL